MKYTLPVGQGCPSSCLHRSRELDSFDEELVGNTYHILSHKVRSEEVNISGR